MIYVTHDQTEALTFADQVLVMNEGTVVQSGAPDELFERPRHTFVGHFIGSPGMNVLPATLEGEVARFAGHPVALASDPGRPVAGARLEIGIRPEFVRFAGAPDAIVKRVNPDGANFRWVHRRTAGRRRALRGGYVASRYGTGQHQQSGCYLPAHSPLRINGSGEPSRRRRLQ